MEIGMHSGVRVIAIAIILVVMLPAYYMVPINIYKHGLHLRHVDVDQRVSEYKLTNGSYLVSTDVYVKNLFNFVITIEYWDVKEVPVNKIEETKIKQYQDAILIKDKVDQILRSSK